MHLVLSPMKMKIRRLIKDVVTKVMSERKED